jgi:fermentation-respiration switch protein FrsA (DUF1100 family)
MGSGPARRLLLQLLLLPVVLYAVVCLLVLVFQDRLVWFPDRARPVLPRGDDVEELELVTTDGVRLVAWLLEARAPRGWLLFCHGNAGNVESRVPVGRTLRDLGWSVLLLDYRGYGASAGRPSEEGTVLDAEAAFDALVARRPDPVALFGESLGVGVALELARRRPVAALVLESGFTSIPDMGASAYPWLPARWLARIRYDNLAKIGTTRAPILLVHSPHDEIVPFAHAERLRAAAPPGTELLATRGGHNDGGFLLDPAFVRAVERFLDRAAGQ